MNTAKSFLSLSIGALAFLAACGSGDSSNGFQEGGSSGSGGASTGSGGVSTGTAGSGNTGMPGLGGATTGAAPAPIDGGIACGIGGGCAVGQECCMSGFTPRCVPPGACMNASSLDCTSGPQCSGGGGMCCFVLQTPDAGAAGGGGLFGGGGGAMMTYTATCTSQCPAGDMMHYQLCADATECPTGQQCTPGQYGYNYCNVPPEGGAGGFRGGGTFGGGGMPTTMDASTTVDATTVIDASGTTADAGAGG